MSFHEFQLSLANVLSRGYYGLSKPAILQRQVLAAMHEFRAVRLIEQFREQYANKVDPEIGNLEETDDEEKETDEKLKHFDDLIKWAKDDGQSWNQQNVRSKIKYVATMFLVPGFENTDDFTKASSPEGHKKIEDIAIQFIVEDDDEDDLEDDEDEEDEEDEEEDEDDEEDDEEDEDDGNTIDCNPVWDPDDNLTFFPEHNISFRGVSVQEHQGDERKEPEKENDPDQANGSVSWSFGNPEELAAASALPLLNADTNTTM
jgi:hypothetical protein